MSEQGDVDLKIALAGASVALRGLLGALLAVTLVLWAVSSWAWDEELPYRPDGPWVVTMTASCPPDESSFYRFAEAGCGGPQEAQAQGPQCATRCESDGDEFMPWEQVPFVTGVSTAQCQPRDAGFRLILAPEDCGDFGQSCVIDGGDPMAPEPPYLFPAAFSQEVLPEPTQHWRGDASCSYPMQTDSGTGAVTGWTEHLLQVERPQIVAEGLAGVVDKLRRHRGHHRHR